MNKKQFIFKRGEIAKDFVCSRCNRKKKSKNTAMSEDGKKVLCNSCYGLLLSKGEIIK